jgi:glucose/arabinose dehydrogenase
MKLKLLLPMFLLGISAFAQTIALQQFASGFSSISEITHAGTSRMYVVQQGGLIRIVEADGTINSTPFINLSSVISFTGERGLLGLAFHPNYAVNGYFFVYYTNTAGNLVIARYNRSTTNPDVANPSSAAILLTIPHPGQTNHNGGCMRFGPDGYLYISTGDGGGSGDPNGNSQNTMALLGKMLRLDVNGITSDSNYFIPSTNPFAIAGGAQEVWASGLRNAWKFSFKRGSSEMWIADVGQGQLEEINKVSATTPGLNFGWRCYEGNSVYNNSGCPAASVFTFPVAQYGHTGGACSITGGYVYTGTAYTNLQNKYLFADFCSNRIGWVDSTTPANITWTPAFTGGFTTFAEDVNGELYIAGGSNGIIYKITDATAATTQFSKAGITLHPNPASNEVFVNLENIIPSATVTVYDMGGKRLLKQPLTTQANRIDTSALQSGIYMLEVNAAGIRMHQKLVIN